MRLLPDELKLILWALETEAKATAALIRAHEERPREPWMTLPPVPPVLTAHLSWVRRTIAKVRML